MEVVVALAQSYKSGDDMVSRRMLRVEGLLAQPVGQRVDTESRLHR
jgi:hypothetical protein